MSLSGIAIGASASRVAGRRSPSSRMADSSAIVSVEDPGKA
jgi:hypothetical protein